MSLNKKKFELVTHKLTKDDSNLALFDNLPFNTFFNHYKVGKDLYISPSKVVKDLGVLISNDLSWECHIDSLCKWAKRSCAWILNIFHTREKTTMLTLFHSLVRSKLEYCCQLWDPSQVKLIDSLEQIQRSFTHKIDNMKDLDYWTRLSTLDIMSLQRRREKLTILLVWKIKNNLVPNDINFEFAECKRTSRIRAILKPLPHVKGKLLSSYEDSFLVKSAKLWNKLPPKLTEISSFAIFQSRLQKYLSFYPDQPPVHGYYHNTKNSILDYRTVSYKAAFGD
jgi:hypothetical protein